MAYAAAKLLSRLVEPGQIVQPWRTLLALALLGTLQLIAQVDERFLAQRWVNIEHSSREPLIPDTSSEFPSL